MSKCFSIRYAATMAPFGSFRGTPLSSAPLAILICLAGDEEILGDLPADAVHAAPRSDAHERLARGPVDHVVAPVELGIVGGVFQLVSDEEALGQGVGLDLVDRITLLGAARERGEEERAKPEAGEGRKAHGDSWA
ncbi:MAG: hypothetical protein QM820_36685 [Minicystis sp.]